MKVHRCLFVVATLILSMPCAVEAQTYPDRHIKIVVPLTAGSPVTVIARVVTSELSSRLGQTVIIDNQPGGGSIIGTKAVARSNPDGYTLLFAAVSHVISPALRSDAGYDPIKDFAPIAVTGASSWVMVVAPSVPAKTLSEFVAYAKENPGKLNFGFGTGTGPHLIGEMFKKETGTDIADINYKGGAGAITDMLGGRIQLNFGTIATLLPLIQSGKVRALAVTSKNRSHDLPDVPTMIESGYPRLTYSLWTGLLAPAGTPVDIINKVNAAINESVKSESISGKLSKLGVQAETGSPEDFRALIAKDQAGWAAMAKSAGY